MNSDPYSAWADNELACLPHGFREDLYEGQVVLVTGGAGGIGRAICMLLGRLGARVVACGRDQLKLDNLRESFAGQGIDVATVQANVREPEEVAALIDTVWAESGALDLVVNNAGGQFAAPATDISPKGWAAVVETNLYGPWYVMQQAAQSWIERERAGSIVNIGTITGRASVGIPHTAAARAGAEGLSASLSVEWAPHEIRINTVAVGVVRSPGLVNYPDEARSSFDHNPQRRLGDVQDVAQAVAFLGAPTTASFVTGETFHVAGGEQVWGEYWALGKPDYFYVEDGPDS
ncbi:MAG TPA: short-chain dehydrogenase [Acidimicrobiaceae bacterium]|nr:short-chain dehydrogenase [Acidimicrobiaceae bacterium]HAX05313.1 short-chain dehydrogenase [Acidimicrobiaceae bacterium]